MDRPAECSSRIADALRLLRSQKVRLGSIQRRIMSYLNRCGPSGGFIGATTKAIEFRGLDLEQIERSLACLLKRGIIRKDGIRYIAMKTGLR